MKYAQQQSSEPWVIAGWVQCRWYVSGIFLTSTEFPTNFVQGNRLEALQVICDSLNFLGIFIF